MNRVILASRKWLIASIFVVLGCMSVLAQTKQDWKELGKQKLAKMDVSSIRTGHLLNLGLFQQKHLDQFRFKPKNKQGLTTLSFTEQSWRNLYENLAVSNIQADKPYKDYTEFAKINKVEKSTNTIIPIGIINTDATLLDTTQVAENIKLKGQSKKADNKKYETVFCWQPRFFRKTFFRERYNFTCHPPYISPITTIRLTALKSTFRMAKGFRCLVLKNDSSTTPTHPLAHTV